MCLVGFFGEEFVFVFVYVFEFLVVVVVVMVVGVVFFDEDNVGNEGGVLVGGFNGVVFLVVEYGVGDYVVYGGVIGLEEVIKVGVGEVGFVVDVEVVGMGDGGFVEMLFFV